MPSREEQAMIDMLLSEARRKHPDSFCWACPERKDASLPYPCVYGKRWLTEGFCRFKQEAESKKGAS